MKYKDMHGNRLLSNPMRVSGAILFRDEWDVPYAALDVERVSIFYLGDTVTAGSTEDAIASFYHGGEDDECQVTLMQGGMFFLSEVMGGRDINDCLTDGPLSVSRMRSTHAKPPVFYSDSTYGRVVFPND